MIKEDKFDKVVKEVDKKWNCLENSPLEFNIKKYKKTKECLKK